MRRRNFLNSLLAASAGVIFAGLTMSTLAHAKRGRPAPTALPVLAGVRVAAGVAGFTEICN